MSVAHKLLQDLAVIGATVQPAGKQLILRAGATPVPADLVRQLRAAKTDLIALLNSSDENASGNPSEKSAVQARPQEPTRPSTETRVIEWRNQHPEPSPAGFCTWCNKPETPSAVVVPFGVVPGTHTWLHPECWPAWSEARRRKALSALIDGLG
jgi:hypothetical protein